MSLVVVLRFALPILDRLSPPWLIFVVGVILLMLHSQTLSLLHKRALLYLIEQSENSTRNYTNLLNCAW